MPFTQVLAGLRVLLVEDYFDLLEAECALLRAAGATVKGTTEPRKALQLVATFDPDVIVTDLFMPDMDGWGFASAVKATGAQAPIMALTAYASPENVERCRESGFAVCVRKPPEPQQLVDLVRLVAEERRRGQGQAE